LSDIKRSHLLAPAAKLFFFLWFVPFLQNRGDIIPFLFFLYVNWGEYSETFLHTVDIALTTVAVVTCTHVFSVASSPEIPRENSA
jgi:hypothetical protein